MDCAFGDVCDYDTLIWSIYEIREKEGESVEEYMLQIHEAVVVIHHAYPDQVTDQGKNLAQTSSTKAYHLACEMHSDL